MTVMKGSTTQAMTSPRTVPLIRLKAASTAFSSDSQIDSWPVDRPSARSSANSATRSRAETAALTTNPITAKIAAATKPMPRAPIEPRATGSVASARLRPARLSDGRAAGRRPGQRVDDGRHGRGVGRQPPFIGRLDRGVAFEPQERQRGQVDDGGRFGRVAARERAGRSRRSGPAASRPLIGNGELVTRPAPGRLEEGVGTR